MKRGQSSTTTNLIIVVLLVVVLLIVFGRPLYAKSRDIINDLGSRVGITKPKPIVEQPPQGPLREGYVSVWKATAGSTTIPILPLVGAEFIKQRTSRELLLTGFAKITAMPLVLRFDSNTSGDAKAVTTPNIRIRYCGEMLSRSVPAGTQSGTPYFEQEEYCTFSELTFESCATREPIPVIALYHEFRGQCTATYAQGVLTITQLPKPGWYQFDIDPFGEGVYVDGKLVNFNSNTAVLKFEYRP